MDPFLTIHEGFTKDAEGGYVWDAADPGGETNLGVTARVWRAWCTQRGLPAKPMRQLTHADVLPLYRANYWQPLAAKYPWPASAALYDASVNSGPGDGNPFDEAGRESGATWMLWRATQLAPKNATPLQLALAICDARGEYFEAIIRNRPASAKFRAGWFKRLDRLRAWLKANAQPTGTRRIFLKEKDKYVLWDWEAGDVYGGLPLGEALFSQLDLLYPAPVSTTYQGVKFRRAEDGALLFDKT